MEINRYFFSSSFLGSGLGVGNWNLANADVSNQKIRFRPSEYAPRQVFDHGLDQLVPRQRYRLRSVSRVYG